jgi:hypothetical protein
MKLEDILELWKEDSNIDKTDLGEEAVKIPKLHNKYYQIYVHEKIVLRSYEADMKKLKLEKYEFFTQGHTEETRSKMWELPARGLILKADIPMYMDADKELIKLSLKIGVQQEKTDFLESIIKSLTNRGFQIKSAIDWYKFTMGS